MIRSIPAKVLLGFAAILALGVASVMATASLLLAGRAGPDLFVEQTFHFHADTAAAQWRDGGPDALARFLARLDAVYTGHHYFVDAAGRDVTDGTDRTGLIAHAPEFPHLTFEPVILVRPTSDGANRLVVVVGLPGLATTLSYVMWVPVLMAAACLYYTHRLLRPVGRLQLAVERFGRGEFAARSAVTGRDEFGRLADAFDRTAEQIERLVVAERRLLQDVSHELRSPLARLAFAAELAETAADRPAAFARVRREIHRLTELVSELTELTQLEAEPAPAGEATDFTGVVAEVADDCRIEAAAKGCRVETAITDDVAVFGRPVLVRRAVENVVRNAVRYAPVETAVEVRLETSSHTAAVVIRDRGPGVPDGALDDIFAPFYRVEEDRGRPADGGGVGLGLAIARRAVTAHGGRITARNARPGLEVTIALPMAHAERPPGDRRR